MSVLLTSLIQFLLIWSVCFPSSTATKRDGISLGSTKKDTQNKQSFGQRQVHRLDEQDGKQHPTNSLLIHMKPLSQIFVLEKSKQDSEEAKPSGITHGEKLQTSQHPKLQVSSKLLKKATESTPLNAEAKGEDGVPRPYKNSGKIIKEQISPLHRETIKVPKWHTTVQITDTVQANGRPPITTHKVFKNVPPYFEYAQRNTRRSDFVNDLEKLEKGYLVTIPNLENKYKSFRVVAKNGRLNVLFIEVGEPAEIGSHSKATSTSVTVHLKNLILHFDDFEVIPEKGKKMNGTASFQFEHVSLNQRYTIHREPSKDCEFSLNETEVSNPGTFRMKMAGLKGNRKLQEGLKSYMLNVITHTDFIHILAQNVLKILGSEVLNGCRYTETPKEVSKAQSKRH